MITRTDVLDARTRIAGRVRRTPLLLASTSPYELWIKCEFMQHTGVFKTRGAFNRMLAAQERGELDPLHGIVAASGGNAGLANAHAAAALGVHATVFVPQNAPAVKVARLQAYGADVRQVGQHYAEAYEAAVAYSTAKGALLCHAYDQPEVIAGAGTIGLEVLEDLPDVDTVVVAVGGGGLFAGIATTVEGHARVVAVEPANAPTLQAALAAGAPVDVEVSGVAADSLGARRIGEIAFDVASRTHPISVVVDDTDIVTVRDLLWDQFRIAAEHGAAAAYAGLTAAAFRPVAGERVALIVCGANTDPSTLGRAAS